MVFVLLGLVVLGFVIYLAFLFKSEAEAQRTSEEFRGDFDPNYNFDAEPEF